MDRVGPYFSVWEPIPGFRSWAGAGGVYRMIPGYYGPLVRLRHGTTAEERDFTTVPYDFRLDWAAIRGWLSGATGFVTTVYVQRPPYNLAAYAGIGSVNWAQATAGNQPKVNLTEECFDASDSADGSFRTLTRDDADISQDFEILVDAKRNGSINSGRIAHLGSASSGRSFGYSAADSVTASMDNVNFITGTVEDDEWHLFSFLANGASSDLIVDAASVASGQVSANICTITGWMGTTANGFRSAILTSIYLSSSDSLANFRAEAYRRWNQVKQRRA